MSQDLIKAPSLAEQIAAILKDEIRRGAFANAQLPPIRELARRFDVSNMTIHAALRELAAERIVKRIHGKGTFVNQPASQTGRASKVKHLGLFSYSPPRLIADDTYYLEIWEALFGTIAKTPHRLTYVHLDKGRELDILRATATEMRLDGCLLLAVSDRKVLKKIAQLKIPAVVLDHHLDDIALDFVDVDSYQGARAAVAHLLETGNRSVGLLRSPNPANNPDRYRGYCDALKDAGLEPERQFNAAGTPNFDGGYRLMQQLLAEGRELPDALFVWSGTMAAGAVKALAENGRRVPEDLRIVTCGTRLFMERFPGIATCLADGSRLAELAVDLLLKRTTQHGYAPGVTLLPMPLAVEGSAPRARAGAGQS